MVAARAKQPHQPHPRSSRRYKNVLQLLTAASFHTASGIVSAASLFLLRLQPCILCRASVHGEMGAQVQRLCAVVAYVSLVAVILFCLYSEPAEAQAVG